MFDKLVGDAQLFLSDKGTMQGRPSWARALRMIFTKAGVQAVVFYRFYHWMHGHGLRFLPELACRINCFLTGAEIDPAAEIGPGLRLPHPTGIVIGRGVKIGKNVSILHSVTLGGSGAGIIAPGLPDGYPTVGDDVWIFASSLVLGPVEVGGGSVIAANSVVTESVPQNAVVAGMPAKVLRVDGQKVNGKEKNQIETLARENAVLRDRLAELEAKLKFLEKPGSSD